jgi:hypothetical protein
MKRNVERFTRGFLHDHEIDLVHLSRLALSLLVAGAVAQSQITGTVIDKTTGKPAVGDRVVLVDMRTSMKEVAQATTDARGRYSLTQARQQQLSGASYPPGRDLLHLPRRRATEPGNITVYDVAAKVSGVLIDEDVLALVETGHGQLRVIERYAVHNASAPPSTQWSPHSFSIVLPPEAVVASAEAQRPSGLPTTLKLDPEGPQGHYSFNFPIQPDKDDKGTLFQIEYELPYSGGKIHLSSAGVDPGQNRVGHGAQKHELCLGRGLSLPVRAAGPRLSDFRRPERCSRQGAGVHRLRQWLSAARG